MSEGATASPAPSDVSQGYWGGQAGGPGDGAARLFIFIPSPVRCSLDG